MHSPHIVSSCKKEEVIVLDREDGKTIVKGNVEETYGWTVEQLLLSVFELKSVRNPEDPSLSLINIKEDSKKLEALLKNLKASNA